MRKRFEQQTTLGRHLIEDTVIPTAKRMGSMSSLCAALKEIFINPEWNEKIFTLSGQPFRRDFWRFAGRLPDSPRWDTIPE